MPTLETIQRAARALQNGELVGMPTETVYGLSANAWDEAAVAKIFEAKGRPQDNPLIVHICSDNMLASLARTVPPLATALAKRFWPGPLTMILPKAKNVPAVVTAGLDTIAIRFPSHPVARALIAKAGIPLAAPSANLSGSPSPTTAQHVWQDLHGKIPLILDGGSCEVGLESTVVKVEESGVTLLRPGGITVPMLEAVCPVAVSEAVFHALQNGQAAPSPGLKYKHYAPKATVILCRGTQMQFEKYVNQRAGERDYALFAKHPAHPIHCPFLSLGDDPEKQARNLFGTLRELDQLGAQTVYVYCPPVDGIGMAVYNRLLRASAFTVVTLTNET